MQDHNHFYIHKKKQEENQHKIQINLDYYLKKHQDQKIHYKKKKKNKEMKWKHLILKKHLK